MKNFSIILFASSCVIVSALASSAQTVAVGNCRPHLVSYSTISEAVAAVPAGSSVLVCPGTYPEQVAITQPLTLKGLTDGIGERAVIVVPSGGLVPNGNGNDVQVLVQVTDSFEEFGPVNISNLVVDGAGSGIDCSAPGELIGIEYLDASGTLDNVEVRNQNPGGCGYGISLPCIYGSEVNIRNSSIHDFDNTGIDGGCAASELTLNITSTQILSSSPTVQAGVNYSNSATGLAEHNIITVGGQYGLSIESYYCCMTIKDNTIIGSNVGMYLGGSLGFSPSTVTGNSLFNNGIGIWAYVAAQNYIVKGNTIVQSSVAGIDVDCSSGNVTENNTIVSAPVGIANVDSGDVIKRNAIYNVTASTTPCTD
jgi:parallel beta-helix repeat protein